MANLALKQARMEFKTTPEMKSLITQAAGLMGMDVSSFILSHMAEKAQEVITTHASIKLSLEGQRRFVELMQNPPPPTEAMIELGKLPDFKTR